MFGLLGTRAIVLLRKGFLLVGRDGCAAAGLAANTGGMVRAAVAHGIDVALARLPSGECGALERNRRWSVRLYAGAAEKRYGSVFQGVALAEMISGMLFPVRSPSECPFDGQHKRPPVAPTD